MEGKYRYLIFADSSIQYRKYMAAEGFENSFEVNIDDMLDKTFHTFRKSKTNYIGNHWKWTPFNLVNKHYTR